MMMADLAYYNSTGDAAKRGKTSAGDIHDDLSTRYPGRSSAKTTQPAAKKEVAWANDGLSDGNAALAEGKIALGEGCIAV